MTVFVFLQTYRGWNGVDVGESLPAGSGMGGAGSGLAANLLDGGVTLAVWDGRNSAVSSSPVQQTLTGHDPFLTLMFIGASPTQLF